MRALLLLAFGGPRNLEEVELLLTRLFGGRKPPPEQLERVKDRYRLIGGCSPLPEITSDQAGALEKELHARGYAFKSYVGMRHCHPLIEETLEQIVRDGFKEIVAVPMAPFRSRASTGAYIEELNRAKREVGAEIRVFFVEGWYRHPLFLEALREKIRDGLNQFAPEKKNQVHLIFTAHSLPKTLIENDPYTKEIEESVTEVLKGLVPLAWRIAFQSKGGGPGEWIGPEVEKVLEDLASQKVEHVLVVPIGFVSDHIEILYDIDIVYRKKAESLGMNLKRTSSLNASESFIKALSTIVEEHLIGSKDPMSP
jgi:protoporphyrin/coproporphyrin ferrochelatase